MSVPEATRIVYGYLQGIMFAFKLSNGQLCDLIDSVRALVYERHGNG